MPELKARAHTLNELADGRASSSRSGRSRWTAANALLTPESRALLRTARDALSKLGSWNQETLEQCIREVAEREDVKLGKLAQPLRAALTGRTTSPGIFDVLALLGQGESLNRIEDQIVEPKE
jgi:glutamyl-tRNA synthetase